MSGDRHRFLTDHVRARLSVDAESPVFPVQLVHLVLEALSAALSPIRRRQGRRPRNPFCFILLNQVESRLKPFHDGFHLGVIVCHDPLCVSELFQRGVVLLRGGNRFESGTGARDVMIGKNAPA